MLPTSHLVPAGSKKNLFQQRSQHACGSVVIDLQLVHGFSCMFTHGFLYLGSIHTFFDQLILPTGSFKGLNTGFLHQLLPTLCNKYPNNQAVKILSTTLAILLLFKKKMWFLIVLDNEDGDNNDREQYTKCYNDCTVFCTLSIRVHWRNLMIFFSKFSCNCAI